MYVFNMKLFIFDINHKKEPCSIPNRPAWRKILYLTRSFWRKVGFDKKIAGRYISYKLKYASHQKVIF